VRRHWIAATATAACKGTGGLQLVDKQADTARLDGEQLVRLSLRICDGPGMPAGAFSDLGSSAKGR